MKILFYGDSITDAGRSYDVTEPNQKLGQGYVAYVAGRLYDESNFNDGAKVVGWRNGHRSFVFGT